VRIEVPESGIDPQSTGIVDKKPADYRQVCRQRRGPSLNHGGGSIPQVDLGDHEGHGPSGQDHAIRLKPALQVSASS
jgi:hypothetical protein